MTTQMQSRTVEELNDLLKGEISAAETYVQLLKKLGDHPKAEVLKKIEAETREKIENVFLPRSRAHISQLDQISGM